jgi:hypothetical protein
MATYEIEANLSKAKVQQVHCPNCGSHAEKHYLTDSTLVRVQCSHCDYLMVTCSRTGVVVEAYAPGIYANR